MAASSGYSPAGIKSSLIHPSRSNPLMPSGIRHHICVHAIDVRALVMPTRDNILVLRRSPHDELWAGMWEVPGGKCRWNETSISALKRELLEEAGLVASEIGEILAVVDFFRISKGYRKHYHSFWWRVAVPSLDVKLSREHVDWQIAQLRDIVNGRVCCTPITGRFVEQYLNGLSGRRSLCQTPGRQA